MVTAARAVVVKGSSSSFLIDVHGFGWVRLGLMQDGLTGPCMALLLPNPRNTATTHCRSTKI